MLDVNMDLLRALLRRAKEDVGSYELLATKIGHDKGGLHRIIEKGQKPTLEVLNRIADYLHVPTHELLMGEMLVKLGDLPQDLQDQIVAYWLKRNSVKRDN